MVISFRGILAELFRNGGRKNAGISLRFILYRDGCVCKANPDAAGRVLSSIARDLKCRGRQVKKGNEAPYPRAEA